VAGIKSEFRPTSNRNTWPECVGICKASIRLQEMLEQSAEGLFTKAVELAMAGQYRNPSAVPGTTPAHA